MLKVAQDRANRTRLDSFRRSDSQMMGVQDVTGAPLRTDPLDVQERFLEEAREKRASSHYIERCEVAGLAGLRQT